MYGVTDTAKYHPNISHHQMFSRCSSVQFGMPKPTLSYCGIASMERDAAIRTGNRAILGLRLLSGLRLPQPPWIG